MTGTKALPAVLVVLLVVGVLSVPTASALAVDDPNLRLGKLDPGHTSVHHRNVTNSGSSPVQVDLQVTCNCPVHVQVTPERFDLAPGARQQIEIQVAIPEDADPGLHDTRIQVTQRSTGGAGGTAVASVAINAVYSVRTAKLYFNPPSATGEVPARFVNGFEGTVDLRIEGTLKGGAIERALVPVTASAKGHEERASTTHLSLLLPLEDADPHGTYTLTLLATWENQTTGATGTSGPHTLEVAHGAFVHLTQFQAATAPNGLRFSGTLRSLGTETVDAWLRVTATGPDGATHTRDGGHVALAPGDEKALAFEWAEAPAGTYQVTAQAAYETASGQTVLSSSWPVQQATAPEPSDASSDGPDHADVPVPSDGANDPTLLAIVALAGLGVGAAVAIFARRGGRKT